MNITVLGASGKTGLDLTNQALSAGHQVSALVRTPANFTLRHPSLTVVAGDARSSADIGKALVGSEAVISTLGTMKSDDLIEASSKALVAAVSGSEVDRVVVLSSFLVAPNYKPNLMGRLVGMMMKGMLADKSAGEAVLTASSLEWTVVYATQLDKAPAGSPVRIVEVGETVSMSNGIARTDVARFLLDELTGDGHPRAKVVITGN